jgi:hypothetical protein
MADIVTLYRPVGQKELNLINETGKFPPRLPIQPIFYPVLTFDYAEKIARGWNTKDEASGYVGYVTEFEVRKEYLDRHPVQEAGGRDCQEYWIPAEELDEFNQNIVGPIRVIAEFH